MTEAEKQNEKWMEFDKRMSVLEKEIDAQIKLNDKLQDWMEAQQRINDAIIEGLKLINT